MTHAELVVLAARWLRGTRKCAVVATERQDWRSMENPDAIGWLRDGMSILVECKTSQADFAADLRKPHRIVGGMGRERWYLAQDGVLKPTSWPDGWGLLVVRSGRVFRAAQAVVRPEIAVRSELAFLTRLTRNALSGFGHGVTLGDVDMEAA